MIKSNIKKVFNCRIEKLWNIITDNTKYNWRSDLSKIEIINANNFIEYNKNKFPTTFKITSKKEFKEYAFDIENKNLKGKWIELFNELPNRLVELELTEVIEVNNFFMKILPNHT